MITSAFSFHQLDQFSESFMYGPPLLWNAYLSLSQDPTLRGTNECKEVSTLEDYCFERRGCRIIGRALAEDNHCHWQYGNEWRCRPICACGGVCAFCIVSVLKRKDVKLQQNKKAISLKNNRPYFSYWRTKLIFLERKKSDLSFLHLLKITKMTEWGGMVGESRKHRQIFHYWRCNRNRSVTGETIVQPLYRFRLGHPISW